MRLVHHAFRLYLPAEALPGTIAFYETLQGTSCDKLLSFPERGIDVAIVGAFILLAGSESALEEIREPQALLVVDDLDAVLDWLSAQGATLLHGPLKAPGGRNATLAHPDGLIAEYYQPDL
ncbi:VOC family protein [Pantoea cypripedii]|uniref:Glyoxalase n=1 Tax=Pantoea cypripedii TaxID=55209 RepID=A0A6B9GAS2_PANCY|nr:glyoxalase [Pantoea cypripedii]QGY32450.1 glyoxalase [Pantoea cypripedii]